MTLDSIVILWILLPNCKPYQETILNLLSKNNMGCFIVLYCNCTRKYFHIGKDLRICNVVLLRHGEEGSFRLRLAILYSPPFMQNKKLFFPLSYIKYLEKWELLFHGHDYIVWCNALVPFCAFWMFRSREEQSSCFILS